MTLSKDAIIHLCLANFSESQSHAITESAPAEPIERQKQIVSLLEEELKSTPKTLSPDAIIELCGLPYYMKYSGDLDRMMSAFSKGKSNY